MDSLNNRRINYSQRLFLWLLGYSLLLVGCFVLFQYHREKQFKAEELNAQLQQINLRILDELEQGIKPSELTQVTHENILDGLRISVIASNGHVLYDNTLDSVSNKADHLNRKEIAEAMLKGHGYTLRRHSESTGDTYFYSARKGADGIIVRTAVPYSVSLHGLLKADFGFLWIMGAITAIMCTFGYFATRRLGLHILRLNRFAEQAERGERIYDTEPFPDDELGSISNHIVRLYANLQQANADRNREHRAALHEQFEKERIKKQLTNNINHELKTPVASIKVCLETLIAHKRLSEEKRDEFLHRCLSSTDRLSRLLTDVSLITRMDDGSQSIAKAPTDLRQIIDDVVAECQPIATNRTMTIDNLVNAPLHVNGNAMLLASVFRNLIDNAISYSGGTTVTIQLIEATPYKIVLTVADDGRGVDNVHLQRLFERFYRIDKGRSRAAGGTGLGLSIVKNAVILHGGTISVENRPTGGLLFRIVLPTDANHG